MEHWGTAALTEYSYEDFSSRSNQNQLLWRKDKIKTKSRPELLYYMNSWRRPVCQTPSKPLDISSATVIYQVTDLSKAVAILSDTNVRRSKLDREYLKP